MPTLARLDHEAFWSRLVTGDPEAVTFQSLAEIADAADAVVIGVIQTIESGPHLTDEYGVTGHYATAIVEIDRVLRAGTGTGPGEVVRVWTFLGAGTGEDDYSAEYELLASSVDRARAILFLANTVEWARFVGADPTSGMVDPEAFIILGGQGYLRDVGGKVAAPVVGDGWPEALVGRRFSDAVRAVESALP